MNKKHTYIVIGTIVVIILGYWALGGPIPFTGGDDTQQGQQRPAFVPSDWKEFRNSTVGLAMYVPADASTSPKKNNSVTRTSHGTKSTSQTDQY
jgi:hypothetical protein